MRECTYKDFEFNVKGRDKLDELKDLFGKFQNKFKAMFVCFDFYDDHIFTDSKYASLKFKISKCTDDKDKVNYSAQCENETEVDQFFREGNIVVNSISMEEVLDFNIHGDLKPVNLLI